MMMIVAAMMLPILVVLLLNDIVHGDDVHRPQQPVPVVLPHVTNNTNDSDNSNDSNGSYDSNVTALSY